jgi:hypothetical protein
MSEGTGFEPNTEPRPVVKQMTLAPPATSPVIDTGSCPGVSINTNTVVIPPALLPGAGLLSSPARPLCRSGRPHLLPVSVPAGPHPTPTLITYP